VRASRVLLPLLLESSADGLVLRQAGGSLVAHWSAGVIFDEAPRMSGSDNAIVNLDDAQARVRARGQHLHAIICNAGIMALPKLTVKHGLELQFLTNHVGQGSPPERPGRPSAKTPRREICSRGVRALLAACGPRRKVVI
jgi:hypothetical protein